MRKVCQMFLKYERCPLYLSNSFHFLQVWKELASISKYVYGDV